MKKQRKINNRGGASPRRYQRKNRGGKQFFLLITFIVLFVKLISLKFISLFIIIKIILNYI